MGSPVRCTAAVVVSLLGLLYFCPSAWGQELQERDALCNDDGCFVVYFQRKTFLDSWRSCKEKGGNLATVKLQEEADTIAALFSSVELRGPRTKVRVWIGLQRQPRQCTASRPLRGFSWTTGDQDTQYTNWLRDDSPSTCFAPRCVVMTYGTAVHEQHDNFKWLDGSCSLPVDGYLCHYTYKGMCPAVWREGGGNALYSTPFSLLSSLLTHVPFGSVATVPCPGGTEEEQSVLCTLREDGTVGWSRETPLCSDTTEKSWCDRDNGGCEHFCREAGEHYYCECSDGFQLGDEGQTCVAVDPCHSAPCEFECLPLSDGYRCACPESYMLAPDERGCLDVDECLQSPCEQLCVNAPGTFECRCREGYRPDEEGECEDVDECIEDPCEHACENTPGSHVCHCHLGFSPLPEDPSHCQDTDECQIPGTCQQMCVNYEAGFECYCEVGYELLSDQFSCRKIGEDSPTAATPSYPWVTRQPDPKWDPQEPMYHWTPQQANTDWPPEEEESLDWLTDPPRLESDVIWVTSAPQEEPALNHNPFLVPHTEEPEEEEEEDEEEYTPGWDIMNWNAPAKVQPELEPTPSLSPSPKSDTTPTPTPTPDWYEEEEEDDETTSSPSVLPTSTISAWNLFWISSTPTSQNQELTTWQEPITDQYVPASDYDEADENEEEAGIDDGLVTSPPKMDQDLGQGENREQHTPYLPPPLATQTPLTPDQDVLEVEGKDEQEQEPPQEDVGEGEGEDEQEPPQEDVGEGEDEQEPPQEDVVEGQGEDEQEPPQEDVGEGEGEDEQEPTQEDMVEGEGEDEQEPPQDDMVEGEGEDEQEPPQEDVVEGHREDEQEPPQEDVVEGEGEDEQEPPQENVVEGEGEDEQEPPQENVVEGEGEDEQEPPQENVVEGEGEDEQEPPQENVVEGEGEDEQEPPQENESSQKQGGANWLLVGLLVPLCIFILVMVALGIVYCTRCAVTPRNKSATDCYHWISGAHDKQGAPNLSKGMQSHV